MIATLDETHDPRRHSWVASAKTHAVFPLQNLPFGVFSPPGGAPRGGVAIGDEIFDLTAALAAGLFSGEAERAAQAAAGSTLNPLMALGAAPRLALRKRLCALLAEDSAEKSSVQHGAARFFHKASDCALHLPASIGDYTDFFAGIHHAYNGGVRNRRSPPLSPNYKHVPVAYHGRASSIVVSGTPIRRPHGQSWIGESGAPAFGPCRKLDLELELGVWIGPGNDLGKSIPIGQAQSHAVGLCLLNDWSARDIQSWEAAPLGPFLAKNFGSTVSPWVVTTEALAPFRAPQQERPADDPRPLPYVWDENDQARGAFDIAIEVLISTERMRDQKVPPYRLSRSNLRHLYWTIGQMIAHHASGGCNLRPGDLFGTGTISAPERAGWGSLAELSDDGKAPIALPSGETRGYLEDGDEVTLRAGAVKDGFVTIGFGDCVGRIEAVEGR